MLECWLDWDGFSRGELELATEFIPLFTETFVKNVKRSKGQKMKLAKIHQLRHFVSQIYNFWAAKNISGRIGESNLKEKVKRPSEHTHMEAHNFEYRMAMKDTDRCVIDKAACEAVQGTDSILQKLCPYGNKDKSKLVGHNILGIRWKISTSLGMHVIKNSNKQYQTSLWKGVVSAQEIQDYLQRLGDFCGFLHTDYKPVGTSCRYHGNPIKGWQDWVKVECDGKIMMCQILLFLEVEYVLEANTKNLKIGKYALTHFVNQNVFSDKPMELLYGKVYNDFLIDRNCHLVRGWAKKLPT